MFDGNCGFCRLWIERWRAITGDAVEYLPFQQAAERFPEIPTADYASSVQFVRPDGNRIQGPDAIFQALATGNWTGRSLHAAYERMPGFAPVANFAYRLVSNHRGFFSTLTRWASGSDVRPPTCAIATALWLRALAAVYLIAFASYGVQAMGLVGSRGIFPVTEYLDRAMAVLGPEAWFQLPTVLWLNASDPMIMGLCVAGCALSGVLFFGFVPKVALPALWALYLSLVVGGQEFYSFQWDALLLEAGLLSVLLLPWEGGRSEGHRPWQRMRMFSPHPAGRLLLIWLLFRVMFSSGVVKLTSGDPVWANLTALDYHYWTQPIPNGLAWFAAKLPEWAQRASCAGMFAIELAAPFLMFGPRRVRMSAFWALVALQAGIAATGNYGFFNLLSVFLCLMLVDDSTFRRIGVGSVGVAVPRAPSGRIAWAIAVALFILSLIPFSGAFRRAIRWPEPLAHVYQQIAPFRSINGYGLFAVMTTRRPEIIVQASDDGVLWRNYVFKFKVGPVDRMPPFLGPFMPRLDWQMWFAALGHARENRWFLRFLQRLLEGEPSVTRLLAEDPFHGARPRVIRAVVDDYTFSTWREWRQTGAWWNAEPRAVYVGEIRLPDDR